MVHQSELSSFLERKTPALTALGVFLLISVSLSVESSLMNKAFVVLTSGISFFILLDLFLDLQKSKGLLINLFEGFFGVLLIFFPIWVILSVIVKNFSQIDIIPLILFLIFIIAVPVVIIISKFKKDK
ncbi:MAG: hypothetical protein AABX17_00995 [Nanoarchaeota archaeon]